MAGTYSDIDMGNQESVFDNLDNDDSVHRHTSFAGSSMDHRYQHTMHQTPSNVAADPSYRHTHHQPPPRAGSSVDPGYRHTPPNAGSLVDPIYRHTPNVGSSVDHSSRHTRNAESSVDHSNRHTLHQPFSVSASARDPSYQPKQQFAQIPDNFNSLDQVVTALREAGLESSNLIVGIDFTKSNEWTGRYSFNRRSLHAIGRTPNPYEQAISIIGRTLSPFDEDNLIPCFGFGDASTHDQHVFSFYPDHRPCHGFEEVLGRYREILPFLKLSGPTSFAPIIDAAIDIVDRSNGQYHVLVIIADGQVTRSPDTPPGRFSPQEQATVNSIVAASQYPLSIILVGVGDGPWDAMKQFDDNIPHRAFDNFQFVNFTKIMSENKDDAKKEAAFALAALMEIPLQYRATQHQLFENRDIVGGPHARPLPPPPDVIQHDDAIRSIPTMRTRERVEPTAPPEQVCPICLTNPKDMAFGCGHTTCKDCGVTISSCPLCREPITTRLRLFT